jgi:acyl-CoA thioester hydrolase
VQNCGLDPSSTTDPIALVVHTAAYYFEPISFRTSTAFGKVLILLLADTLEIGLVVAKLGTSSVTYRVGIFIQQDPNSKVQRDPRACAIVDFVHVYCDPKTRKAIPMLKQARAGLERISRPDKVSPKL